MINDKVINCFCKNKMSAKISDLMALFFKAVAQCQFLSKTPLPVYIVESSLASLFNIN